MAIITRYVRSGTDVDGVTANDARQIVGAGTRFAEDYRQLNSVLEGSNTFTDNYGRNITLSPRVADALRAANSNDGIEAVIRQGIQHEPGLGSDPLTNMFNRAEETLRGADLEEFRRHVRPLVMGAMNARQEFDRELVQENGSHAFNLYAEGVVGQVMTLASGDQAITPAAITGALEAEAATWVRSNDTFAAIPGVAEAIKDMYETPIRGALSVERSPDGGHVANTHQGAQRDRTNEVQ